MAGLCLTVEPLADNLNDSLESERIGSAKLCDNIGWRLGGCKCVGHKDWAG